MTRLDVFAFAAATALAIGQPLLAQGPGPNAGDPKGTSGGEPANLAGQIGSADHEVSVFDSDKKEIVPAGYRKGCRKRGCSPKTGLCGQCRNPFWAHRSGAWVDWLYLQPNNADVPFATPVDVAGTTNPTPIGRTGISNPRHESGIRVGGEMAIDQCSSFSVQYWFYESDTPNNISVPGGSGALRPELTHPSLDDVTEPVQEASSNYDIDFQMADMDYKGLLWGGCNSALNYHAGVRYANLEQDYRANYTIPGETTVTSEIDFDGVGPRIGLDGERMIGSSGFLVYGESFANFLVGEFRADYRQQDEDLNHARVGFDDDRIVSVLEMELGLGWQSPSGNFRTTAGYYVSGWFNAMTTSSFIGGAQQGDLDNVEETLGFDGLTVRAEYRY